MRFPPFLRIMLGAALVLLVGCSAASSPTPGSEGVPDEIVYGLTLSPSGIDPHIYASSELGIPLRSVYDTLVYRDPASLDFVPGLARSWVTSDDGLTYTFTLRDDVTFHDGTAFNAEAVRVNIERILDPETNSLKAAQLLGPVERVDVLDEYEVAIVLSEPFAPLLDGLSQPYTGMASPQALAQYSTADYQFNQVGTGPYRFVEYINNDRLVLKANPDYAWGPEFLDNQGAPHIERIVFRFFTDPATRSLALESGDAQIMGEILPTDAKLLEGNESISILTDAIPGQPLQFFFNTRRSPADDLQVRQALILATNREEIVQAVFQNYSPVAYGPISSTTLYYDESVEEMYPYDPEAAAELFGSTGLAAEDIELSLVAPPWGLIPQVAQLLEAQWEGALGIEVTIEQVESFPMLMDRIGSGDFDVAASYLFGLDPAILNSYYYSDARLNVSGYQDAELDELLASAQAEQDPAARAQLYGEIQRLIMDEALVLPIRDYVNLNGYHNEIQNLYFDAQGFFPYLVDLQIGD